MDYHFSFSDSPLSSLQPNSLEQPSYEEVFATLVGARVAVAFSYARTALCSILSGLGIGPGDEVILSPLTCKVIPLSLLSLGIVPKYIDIAEKTLNLDPLFLKDHVTPQTKAVLFQHTYGNPEGIDGVVSFLKGSDIFLIEDCAQCTPVPFHGVVPGSRGIAAIFSHNLLKPIPAGSGGMATTNDEDLGQKILLKRNKLGRPGMVRTLSLQMEVLFHKYLLRPQWYWWLYYVNRKLSSAYRDLPVSKEILDQITMTAGGISLYQSHMGQRWLEQLPSLTSHRLMCCKEFFEGLNASANVDLPIQRTDVPLYYFPVIVKDKKMLLEKAKEKHIELIAWPVKTPIYPVENQAALHSYQYKWGACPLAEKIASRLVGLPTHLKISAEHRHQILELMESA